MCVVMCKWGGNASGLGHDCLFETGGREGGNCKGRAYLSWSLLRAQRSAPGTVSCHPTPAAHKAHKHSPKLSV